MAPRALEARGPRRPPDLRRRNAMLIGEIIVVALSALRVNKLRSLLTMLGIVIGVGAVIAVVALGRGAQQAVNDRISSLGTTMLTVIPGQVFTGGVASSTDRAKLYVEDATALAQRGTFFSGVEPEMSRTLQVQYRNQNTSTRVIGTTPNYLDVRKYAIDAGRMFTESDDNGRQRVAILGATTATNLGANPAEAAVGWMVRISGIQFEVVGVLALKGGASGFNDPDDQVLIPLNTGRFRVFDTKNLQSINVLAASEAQIPQAMTEIESIMRRQHRLPSGRDDDFEIRNQSDFLNAAQQTTQVFGLLLAGIATVSLLVGGIGIMNIMLVSVTERTREVGIRKALGATRRNILAQFLIEAIVLCVLGGIIGIVVGAGTAVGMRYGLHWNTDVSIGAVGAAFVFSALVGVVFGVWPARRAASLDPIVALRYE
ncbi:MAG TPA: ABC transporter permease [Gemmatimonadaceae bacterium]|nr:ABC transporter permease [Gemmatimonadaceae bacterium]